MIEGLSHQPPHRKPQGPPSYSSRLPRCHPRSSRTDPLGRLQAGRRTGIRSFRCSYPTTTADSPQPRSPSAPLIRRALERPADLRARRPSHGQRGHRAHHPDDEAGVHLAARLDIARGAAARAVGLARSVQRAAPRNSRSRGRRWPRGAAARVATRRGWPSPHDDLLAPLTPQAAAAPSRNSRPARSAVRAWWTRSRAMSLEFHPRPSPESARFPQRRVSCAMGDRTPSEQANSLWHL